MLILNVDDYLAIVLSRAAGIEKRMPIKKSSLRFHIAALEFPLRYEDVIRKK